MYNNLNHLNINKKQMDNFINEMLRNDVKHYLKIKSRTNPNLIIKENFIFEVSKEASRRYMKTILDRNLQLLENNLFFNKEIVATITERHIFYIFKADEQLRLKLQNDSEYKNKLIYETVDDLIVNKHLGEISFNDATVLYPPISKIIVLNNLLFELFKTTDSVKIKDSKFVAIRNVLIRIIEQVKSVSLLLDKSLIADAIAIWRGLYESELTLVILSYWDKTISEEYLEFNEFQMAERNINLADKTTNEIQDKLKAKAEDRNMKVSTNFINYGWLMQTQEYYDKNCNLNLKDGLAVIAEQHVKYTSYQLASNISHSPFFSRSLKQEQLLTYVVEIVAFSLKTTIDAIIYYIDELELEVNKDIIYRIDESQNDLSEMIKIMDKNAK